MRKGARIGVLIACTVTSGFGGLAGAVFLFSLADECAHSGYHQASCIFSGGVVFGILVAYLFAWVVYLILGAAWIGQSTVPRWLPVAGTLAALSYFLPVIFSNLGLRENLEIIGADLLLVAPAIILAIVLVKHHRGAR